MIPGLSIPITIDLQRLYGQKINLVQGENAGRRLAFTIVSGGVAVNLTGKILLLTGTKSDGSPVCLPITISSATTGQAYCDIVSGLVSVVGDATLQIRILTPAITGTATSGTATSMYDTSKTWTVNAYVGAWLYINSGTGINQARRIISNTATQLVISDAWGTNPAAGSGYSIVTETGFSFPFTANVAASPDADAAIASTGDFSVLTSAIATAYGLESRIAALETGILDPAPLVGEIKAWAGSTAPGGYLLCDGSAVSRTTYSTLFALIGTTYGAGDGSTTFNVPNCKGRSLIGYDSTQTEFNALGKTGGEKTHIITVNELPNHNHGLDNQRYAYYSSGGTDGITATNKSLGIGILAANSAPQGGGAAHNNLHPYMVANYIIRAV